MRLLVLSVSAIALGACSVGTGYSWKGGQSGYDYQGEYDFQSGYDYSDNYYGGTDYKYYPPSGYPHGGCGVTVDQCGYTPPPPPVYTPPVKPSCGHVPHHCGGGAYSVASYSPDYGSYGSYDAYDEGYSYHLAPAGYAYGTLGAVMYDFKDEKFGVQGRLGYQFNSFLGAELEGSVGVVDETEDLGGGDTLKTGIDYSAGAFGTIRAPLSDRLSAVGRLGYHKTWLSSETTVGGITTEADSEEDGLAYGAGAEFSLSPSSAIRADYTAYEVPNGTLDSVSLAYLRRF